MSLVSVFGYCFSDYFDCVICNFVPTEERQVRRDTAPLPIRNGFLSTMAVFRCPQRGRCVEFRQYKLHVFGNYTESFSHSVECVK